MKLNLKMMAVAAAMVAVAGGAQAGPVGNNPSLNLVAFNTVTNAYYIRDLGILFNDFLPNGVTTLSGNGPAGTPVTPESGLLRDKSTNATFADTAFSTWLTSNNQTPSDVRWMVSGADDNGNLTLTNVRRLITSSANPAESATNAGVDNYIASGNAGKLGEVVGSNLSVSFPANRPQPYTTNFTIGADSLASLDQGVGLFYFARTVGTGSTGTAALGGQYGNSGGFATVLLKGNGDFSYALAPVSNVPLPPAGWLMGAGLMAIGGVIRRRKAAAQA